MIDVENFKDLVNSSINYTGEGVPYLIIDEEGMACPFCHRGLGLKKGVIECGCDKSIEFAKTFLHYFQLIEESKRHIEQLKVGIECESLKFFKEYFKVQVLPKLKKEFDSEVEKILEL
jgi:hypothetical protein